MKAAIYLQGLYIGGHPLTDQDKPRTIANVEYTDEKALITYLKELQSGYSLDGRDKPKIERHKLPSKIAKSGFRTVIDCYTQADWHHVAHINCSINNLPITKLKSLIHETR